MSSVNKYLTILIFFLVIFGSAFGEFFKNETSIGNSDYEKYYNFYAKRLKEDTGLSVYTHFIVSEEGVTSVETVKNIDNRLSELYSSYEKKEKGKFIIVLFSLNTNIIKVKKNYTLEEVKDSEFTKLIDSFFTPHFDYMNYKVNSETGEIEKKMNDSDVYNDRNYLTANIMLAAINFLNGISQSERNDLKISKKISNQFKERASFERKISEYENNILIQQESEKMKTAEAEKQRIALLEKEAMEADERRKKIEIEANKLKEKKEQEEQEKRLAEAAKKEKEKEEEERRKREEEEKNKWKQGVKFSFSYNFYISDGKGNIKTDQTTGLLENIKTNEKYGETDIQVMPYMKSERNGEIVSSFSYKKKDDYINKSKSEEGDFRFNYLSILLNGDYHKLTMRAGDTKIESSKVVANKKYRGYYGSFNYFLDGNPDREIYKTKIKEKKISDKEEQSLRIAVLTAPDKGTLGIRDETQYQTNAFLFDFIRQQDGLMHVGYIFGEAKREDKKNSAQEIIIELEKKKIKTKVGEGEYLLQVLYNVSESYSGEKREKRGDKLDLKGVGKLSYNRDFTSLYARYNFINSKFDVDLLSEKYEDRNIPTFIDEKTAFGQYGYELKLENTLFGKKLENKGEYYSFWKSQDYKKYYKNGYYVYNKSKINNSNTIYDSYKYIRDINEREGVLNIGLIHQFVFGKKEENLFHGSITPDFRHTVYSLDDKEAYREVRTGISESGAIVFKNIGIFDRQSIDATNYDYRFTTENFKNISMKDNIFFTESEIDSLRGDWRLSLYNSKNIHLNYSALSYGYSQGIIVDDLFYQIAKDKKAIKGRVNFGGYSYRQELKDKLEKDITGNNIRLYMPLEVKGINIEAKAGVLSNSDNIEKIKNENLFLDIRGEKEINKKWSAFAAINYEKKKYELYSEAFVDKQKVQREGTINKEHNETIATLNKNIAEIYDKIRIGNLERYEVSGGAKYKLISKSKLELKAVSSGYIENVKYYNTQKDYKSIGVSIGEEAIYTFNRYLSATQTTEWKPYFEAMTGKYLKDKMKYELGLYSFKKLNKIGLKGIYASERYLKSSDKINNIEKGRIEFKGDGKTKDEKGKISYSLQYENIKEYNAKREIIYIGNLDLQGNIYTKEKDNKKNTAFLERSDIFTYLEGSNNKSRYGISKHFSVKTGGSADFFGGWNRIETGGVWVRRKNITKTHEEESAEIYAKDTQKLHENITLDSNISYSANISGTEAESDFKMMKSGVALNVSRIVISNITASADYSREVYIYPEKFREFDKSINKGSITLKISF